MALVLQKTLIPASGCPEPAERVEPDPRLNIAVVFTSVEGTLAALRNAADLANRLAARITLIVPQVVPFPLPLETPPVLLDWNERRFGAIAEVAPVETKVQVYLCRDRDQALSSVLGPASLVVLGGRRSWWPTWERRLARILRRAGHEVILAEAN
jgi:hypothetical protein